MLHTTSPNLSVVAKVQPTSPLRVREDVYIPFPGTLSPNDTTGPFRHISIKQRTGRDLPDVLHEKMIAMSFLAWRTNPLARRLIEMEVDFTLGGGLTLTSDDKDTLDVLNEWWTNDYNDWPQAIHQRLRDLLIYGEWLHHPIITKKGMVLIRDLQPDIIKEAVSEPGNHSKIDAIVLKKIQHADGTIEENRVVLTIRRRLIKGTNEIGAYSGDMFLFGINRTTDSLRGIGELFTLIDYIDLYDEVLFGRAEKIVTMSHVWFDLMMEGKTEQEMRDYIATETNIPPKPGSVYVHNKSAELKAVTPDLKADDHVEDVRVLKSHIISGFGWPGTFFDDPGSAGRAVGAEMAEPALKMIISRQNMLKRILQAEMNYVLDIAKQHKKIGEPGSFDLSFSRPSMRDLQRLGPALARLSQFVAAARLDNELTQTEARQIVVSQINQLALTDAPLEAALPTELRDAAADAKAADDDDNNDDEDDNFATSTKSTTNARYSETLL